MSIINFPIDKKTTVFIYNNLCKLFQQSHKFSYYFYIKNIEGIIDEVQNNSYEFHIWNSLVNQIKKPDILIFDLDPDENLSLKELREGVKNLKKILDNYKLKSFLKTSGGKGYHIYVPLNTLSYKQLNDIAKNISMLMRNKWSNKYTVSIRKKDRINKIFIDYFRNREGATSVCPYSIRLKNKCTISCSIYWNELDNIKPDGINIKNYKNRIKKNPWKNFFME